MWLGWQPQDQQPCLCHSLCDHRQPLVHLFFYEFIIFIIIIILVFLRQGLPLVPAGLELTL